MLPPLTWQGDPIQNGVEAPPLQKPPTTASPKTHPLDHTSDFPPNASLGPNIGTPARGESHIKDC
ncbi:hypothetical protein L484_026655 [Morus notabilis]|uniref:Uncharacterized protein n=1 Tax=Morus notabilis TaxID=981085 RepID=W9SKJ2_9ROSA|nr:hypothetical protein L484_026655 [Morus notabilis]